MRRFLLAAALVLAVLFGPAASVAWAQEIPNDAPAVAPVASLTLNAFTVTMLVSLFIPVATGIASRWLHSVTALQVFTLFLAAVNGIVTAATQLDGTAIISLTTLQYAVLDFLVATAAYLGLYKPHDTNTRLAGSPS